MHALIPSREKAKSVAGLSVSELKEHITPSLQRRLTTSVIGLDRDTCSSSIHPWLSTRWRRATNLDFRCILLGHTRKIVSASQQEGPQLEEKSDGIWKDETNGRNDEASAFLGSTECEQAWFTEKTRFVEIAEAF
ncbi:hypothetical protein IGI04_029551 [Brassica rapa subsp. trilocularis]|uniref:Uncharacterized protein n=1 Tax=Brassica rapa subsp. trilocularis TaxID=1813537 RepID=A0ABQ7LPU3_BRACM|nr:hypothetical protein IGI04_029551 [Brassica rapa subsp. trilocularis]